MNEYLVLVVEDDKPIRNLITTTLKMNDYRYITASRGHEAIMLSASHKPDMIVLDLGLPDIRSLLSAPEARIRIKSTPLTRAPMIT